MNQTIYVATQNGHIYAVSKDGQEIWHRDIDEGLASMPVIGNDGTIYFGTYKKHLYALNPDGETKWVFQSEYYNFSTPALGADGTIYVGSSLDYEMFKEKYDYSSYHDRSPKIGTISRRSISNLIQAMPATYSISCRVLYTAGSPPPYGVLTITTTTYHLSLNIRARHTPFLTASQWVLKSG